MYEIRARCRGGLGASIRPIVVATIGEAKEEIEDLLACDHAVQLYKISGDERTTMQFEFYTSYHVSILGGNKNE